MIKLPVKRGDNQVFPAIADADGNEICVCVSEDIREQIIVLLNASLNMQPALPERIVDGELQP